jgi:DNA polymerase III alpha subunit (gram-positive type)
MGKVAVDITASGPSPEVYGELISISACEMLAPGQAGAFFHSYINPSRQLGPLWERLLEIDNETLNTAPPLAEVAEQFFAFLADRQIVCTGFEMTSEYLNDALAQLGRPTLPSSAFISVWNMVPKAIFETDLEAIDEYAEVPPEKYYSAHRSSLRVAEMYWNVCAKQGLSD